MWDSLNIDIRCKILRHMEPTDRLKVWVAAGERSALQRLLTLERSNNVRFIARTWASIGRDANIEADMENIVGGWCMVCAAAYLGFEYVSVPASVPVILRASWAAMGSHRKLLLQLIAQLPSGTSFDDIWLPIVDNDSEEMAKLMLLIRAMPSLRVCWHMGRTGAPKVAKTVLQMNAEGASCEAEHAKTILCGCVHADRDDAGPFRVTDIVAKWCMFREILGLKGDMLSFHDLADIVDVIINRKASLLKNEGTCGSFEYMWFTQFLLEEYTVHGAHHSGLLSYFAGQVIRMHDVELLHYIIHASVEWGLWTLTETMLWTACAHGTAAAVAALLTVPNIVADVSPPAYYWAVQNDNEMERAAIVTCLREANVPIQDDANDSGLEAAVLIDNPSIAMSFLEWGADVTLRAFGRCRSAEMRTLLKMYVPADRLSEFEAHARYELCGRELPAWAT